MNRRILQMAVCSIVCAATWIALTPVRAQPGAANQASSLPGLPQGTKTLLAPETVPVGGMRLTPNVSMHAGNSYFTVRLDANNHAVVDGSVEVGDTHPGQTYMWVLRVKSEDNTTLSTATYAHQLFEVTPVQVMTPKFHDVIAVPPGESWVRLTLYRFPNHLDPALFEDEGKVDQYSLVSRSQKVNLL